MRRELSLSPSRGYVKRPCWLIRDFQPELDVPSEAPAEEQKSFIDDEMTREEYNDLHLSAVEHFMPDDGERVLPHLPNAIAEIADLPVNENKLNFYLNLMHERRMSVHVIDFHDGGCSKAKEVAAFAAEQLKLPVHCHFKPLQQGLTCGVIAANAAISILQGRPVSELERCASTEAIRKAGYNPRTCQTLSGTKILEIVRKVVNGRTYRGNCYVCPWDHFHTWQYLHLLRKMKDHRRLPDSMSRNFLYIVNTQKHDVEDKFKHWFVVAFVYEQVQKDHLEGQKRSMRSATEFDY